MTTPSSLIVDFPSDSADRQQQQLDSSSNQAGSSSSITATSTSSQSVSFSEHINLTFVENLSHTKKYKTSLWYNKLELDQFQLEAASAMRDMLLSRSNSDEDYLTLLEPSEDTTHFLGLENCLSRRIYFQVSLRRKAHRHAIFFEQHRQLVRGIRDADLIANVSEVESDWARGRASLIGLLHAADDAC